MDDFPGVKKAGTRASILTGARAKIMINGQTVGLFSQCSWSIRQGKEPAFILGSFGPVEITPTTQEAITMSLSGYRVMNNGPYAKLGVTALQDLLQENDFSVIIEDRQPVDKDAANEATTKMPAIFKAFGCRVQGWSSGVSARGVSDVRIDVIGLTGEDESGHQNDPSAATLLQS